MPVFPTRRPRVPQRVPLPQVHIPEDAAQGRFNIEVQAAVAKLLTHPLLNGVYLDLADFDMTNNVPRAIPHGLGRTPRGVVLVHHTGDGTTTFFEDAAPDDEYVHAVVTDVTFDYILYVY